MSINNTFEKFSALGCVYLGDKKKYLIEAFDSIVNQTMLPNEVVLVKDGPISEKISKVINSYKNKLPLKILKLEKNSGLGIALQYGLEHCVHDLIIRFDSDDINRKDRFQKQIQKMSQDKTIDVLSGHISEFKKNINDINNLRKSTMTNIDVKKYILWRNPINHAAVAFKKSSVLSAGGYLDHHLMEDYNLWIRMVSKKNVIMSLDEVLVDVRIGSGMIYRRKGINYIKSELKLAFLKNSQLNISSIKIIFSFIVRTIPRLLPSFILNKIYFILRSRK